MFLTTVFLALWAFIKSLLCCSSAPEVDEEKAIDTTFQVVVDGGNLARVKRAHLRAERANLYLAPPRPPFYRYGDAPLPSVPPPPPVAFPVRAAVLPNLAGGLPPTAHLKTGCEPRAAANTPSPAPATKTAAEPADKPADKLDAASLTLVVWRRPLSASDFGVACPAGELFAGGNITAEEDKHNSSSETGIETCVDVETSGGETPAEKVTVEDPVFDAEITVMCPAPAEITCSNGMVNKNEKDGLGVVQKMESNEKQNNPECDLENQNNGTANLNTDDTVVVEENYSEHSEKEADVEENTRGSWWLVRLDQYLLKNVLSDRERMLIIVDLARSLDRTHTGVAGWPHGAVEGRNISVGPLAPNGRRVIMLGGRGDGWGGAPGWTSPEVLRGEGPTAATDLFGLGLVVHWLWTERDLEARAADILTSLGEGDDRVAELADQLAIDGPSELWRRGDADRFQGVRGKFVWDLMIRLCAAEPSRRPLAWRVASGIREELSSSFWQE